MTNQKEIPNSRDNTIIKDMTQKKEVTHRKFNTSRINMRKPLVEKLTTYKMENSAERETVRIKQKC